MKVVKKWVMLSVGLVIFIIGAILFPLPIPFGLILMIIGLSMMATHPAVLRFLRRVRNRFPKVSARLHQVTPHLPGPLKRFIRSTEMPRKKRLPLIRRGKELAAEAKKLQRAAMDARCPSEAGE